MTRNRSILLVGGRSQPLDDALEFAAGRRAEVVVLDDDRGGECARHPVRASSIGDRLASRIAACVRAVDADLVMFPGDLPLRTVNEVRRSLRPGSCDFLVMAGRITSGCVVAAIDPAAGEVTNAGVLGTALAHSHLFRCDLHVVHAWSAGEPDPRDPIAELVAPIWGFDRTRMHIVSGQPAESVAAFARGVEAALVVLGSSTRESDNALGRIAWQVLRFSSTLVVESTETATGTMSRSPARRRSPCGAGR